MSLKLPLFGRVILWFFLNLVLLGVGAWVFVSSELKLEPLLGTLARDRIQPIADSLLGELRARQRSEWNVTLERFGDAYGIQFIIADAEGRVIAGSNRELPEAVRGRFAREAAGPMQEPGPPEQREREGRGEFRGREGGDPVGRLGPGGRRRNAGLPPQFVRTRNPDRYWFLLQAGPPWAGDRRPMRLLMASETWSANGLFFDARPWIWGGTGVFLFCVLWWAPFVRNITGALGIMTQNTRRISEGRFDLDAGSGRGDELGRLDAAIRQMAGRLDGFVNGQKRFLGDIAHELCSPLARMEMALAVLEQRADVRQKEYIEDVREEVRLMSAIVNDLLSFSKAGIQGVSVDLVEVPLADLVKEVVQRDKASDLPLRVDVPADLKVQAEPKLLSRALGNLIRNAIRHAGAAGPILVQAGVDGGRVFLQVLDEGPGVPEEAIEKLGQPFYRPDEARARETGGFGLGLAIVRTCVEACRGSVVFANRKPKGFSATLWLSRV